jgi:MFS family permease
MAGGLALLGAFVAIEARFARQPLMPLRIYRSRTLSASNVIVLLIGAATFAMWFFLSLYLQQVRGYSAIRAGLAFLPMTLCIIAGSTFASRAVTRLGTKPLLVAGLLAQVAGLALFAGVSPSGTYLGQVLAPSLLVAIGIGLSFVPATISAVSGVAAHEAGLASGLVNTSRLFGGALGLAVLAALATAHTNHLVAAHHAVGSALTSGFDLAFGVAAAISLAGAAIAVVAIPRVRPRVAAADRARVAAETA